jgi:hypothetical protein
MKGIGQYLRSLHIRSILPLLLVVTLPGHHKLPATYVLVMILNLL